MLVAGHLVAAEDGGPLNMSGADLCARARQDHQGGVGGEQRSSLSLLCRRLAAAGTALSEANLEVLVIQAEAIMVARATSEHST